MPQPPTSNRIVAGVDGSDAALRAVRSAVRECARRSATLTLVHAFETPVRGYPEYIATVGDVRAALEKHGREVLAEAEAVARAISPGVAVELRLREQGPAPALIAESHHAALVVVGSRGLGGFSGLVVGSTAVALSRLAECPVVVVRGEEPEDGRVVVGVDGSPASEQAIAFAFEAASRRHASLAAVMSWTDVALDAAFGNASSLTLDWARLGEEHRELLAQRLAGWTERYPEVVVNRIVVHDRPVRALLREAEHAQLLVVGSRGRGGFAGLLLGSTSQSLIYHAPCPIAVVRPVGEADDA
ncbi:nucleotide-binding universal stress UspA family protein [Crossiella equi]|uniref:Nucleotide-binding universal stress UspA family protein n=1 Tax=Crossiella equi TaxID=130796 RepID=A0ABS5ASD5_9PSEU|nr:universal stress protein [Crossiella equi]MBP2479478.1 nucleotide-binding universal stress UspA family protein [Crossiella equi]